MEALFLRVVLLLAITTGLAECISQICPSRRYALREANGNSSCYLLVQSPLSYAAANRSCVRDDAILLSIGSPAENEYVRNNFFINGQEFWIGLNDIVEEGTFRWENSSVEETMPYTNWSRDFPNDNRESRDCVKFSSDGWKVHEQPCSSSQLPFVCKSNTCSSDDGENCIDSVTTVAPAPLVDAGGISAIVIILIIVVAVLIIVPVTIFLLWKFKNDVFNRFCCFCCGGGERSKVRNLQQENQRLRQQLSQHRLSVSGRMQPGQFSNALAGVPDGRGGMLPAIKQPLTPTNIEERPLFLSSSIGGGGGPPPLNIQRQTPGPFIGGRPPLTAPAGPAGLPRVPFTGTTPIRPVRQSLPLFGSSPSQQLSSSIGTRPGGEAKPVTTATLVEEEESESSGDSESGEEGAESQTNVGKQDSDKNSQQE